MNRLNKLCFLVSVFGVLLAAPAAKSQDQEDTANDVASTLGAGMQRLVDLAVSDLATKLKVDEHTIEIVEAQIVTWRDSSAGCPQPGMQYLQVLTNGSRIVLRVDEMTYHYHSGGSRAPAHCAKPSKTEPLPYSHGEA
jgi:hypothetical protein